MAIPRWITSRVGRAAQVAGRTYDYLTPGAGTSTLTNVGRNIVDPNMVYTGGLTPAGLVRSATSPQSEFQSTGTATAPGGTEDGTEGQMDLSLATGDMTGGGTGIDYGAVNTAKSNISALISSIGNLYDSIYNTQVGATKEQLGNLESAYNKGTQALAETFTNEMPKLQASYNARGTGDSTEAMGAAYQAGKAYESQLENRAQEYGSNVAQLGQSLVTSKAAYDAQRNAYAQALQQLQGSTDIDELTSFRNSLDQKIAELQAQSAGTMSESGYRQALSQAIPQQPDATQLQANLTTLIQGQAAPMVKKSVGLRMIDLSGLPETTKRQLSADFSAAIDSEQEQLQPLA